MAKTYIVSFGGGYEQPSFKGFATWEEAITQATSWQPDCLDERGDRIDILVVNHATHHLTLIKTITEVSHESVLNPTE